MRKLAENEINSLSNILYVESNALLTLRSTEFMIRDKRDAPICPPWYRKYTS